MIRHLIGALATACMMAVSASAQADQDPKAIVRQAIAAMGGRENVRQIRAIHAKFTGRQYFQAGQFHLEGEIWRQPPDQLKQTRRVDTGGQNQSVVEIIVRGNDAWCTENGVPQHLQRAEIWAGLYEEYVAALWPLLDDPSFTLTIVPGKTVDGRPAHGVRVAKGNRPDLTLFFDQETHLLVLKQWSRLDHDKPDRKTVQEELNYRDIDFRIEDAKRLQQARIDTSDASLLAFLRKQVLSEAGRARCQILIDRLGDPSFIVRMNVRQELARYGLCVAPLLRSAAKSRDLEIRTATNDLLEKAIAESANTGSIPAALRLLADRRTPGAIAVILAYMPCASSDLLSNAAQKALADLATNQGQPDPCFEKALANADPAVQAMARASVESARRLRATNTSQQLFLKGIKFPFRFQTDRDDKKEGKEGQEIIFREIEFYSQLADSVFAPPP